MSFRLNVHVKNYLLFRYLLFAMIIMIPAMLIPMITRMIPLEPVIGKDCK